MDTGSTKSEISEISASPTIQILATAVSAMTEVVEGIKSVLKATDDDRKKREEKATKSRIQREKVEEKDRADKRKEDKKEAKTIQRKDKAEVEERIKVEEKETVPHSINSSDTSAVNISTIITSSS